MNNGIRRIRKAGVGALASLTALAGLAPFAAQPAGAAFNVSSTRYAGADRYDTAGKIAVGAFGTADNAIIASGENFPDALSGAYLAGSLNAPVLLTPKDSLSSFTASALQTLKTKSVTILGGTQAVSAAVETALKAATSTNSAGGSLTVTRVAGATRYDTAKASNETPASTTVGLVGGKKTAILATGEKFPDALFGGAMAFAKHFPVILTTSGALSDQARATLTDLGIQQVVIMGGTVAVGSAVESAVNAMGITTLFRAAGANRDDTAAKLLEWKIANLGFSTTSVFLARDDDPTGFADALAMGPAAGKLGPFGGLGAGAPSASLPTETTAALTAHASTLTSIYVPGGTAAVPDAKVTAALTAAGQSAGLATATARPELVAARIVSTTTVASATTAKPQGTTVSYTFDQPVTGLTPDVSKFHVYKAAGTQLTATTTNGTTATATIETADPKTVDVLYPQLTTADTNATTGASDLTVATVELGAVTGLKTNPALHNPEGAAPIGTAQTGTLTAGRTTAPDLISVSGFRSTVTSTVTAVDFTFDQSAYVQNTTGFELIDTSGHAPVACTGPATNSSGSTSASGLSVVGGNGTTVITVLCPQFTISGSSVNPSSSNTARGIVLDETVGTTPPTGITVNGVTGDSSNVTNQTEASASPHAATPGPDLTSATFTAGATSSDLDTVVFTFDQAVLSGSPVATKFHVITAAAGLVNGQGTPTVNSANPAQVSVSFANGTVGTGVAVSVDDSAVTAVDGTPNRIDEIGVTNTTTSTITPGKTAGPDLTGVALTLTKDAFGNTTAVKATYTFDERVDNGSLGAAALYHLYMADGTRFDCNGTLAFVGSGASVTGNNQVSCDSFTFSATAGEIGTNTGTPTVAQVASATAGTVQHGAVTDNAGRLNPEGYAVTTGGTGTAVNP